MNLLVSQEKEAGFNPQLRNQQYGFRDLPENIRQQQLDGEEMIVD